MRVLFQQLVAAWVSILLIGEVPVFAIGYDDFNGSLRALADEMASDGSWVITRTVSGVPSNTWPTDSKTVFGAPSIGCRKISIEFGDDPNVVACVNAVYGFEVVDSGNGDWILRLLDRGRHQDQRLPSGRSGFGLTSVAAELSGQRPEIYLPYAANACINLCDLSSLDNFTVKDGEDDLRFSFNDPELVEITIEFDGSEPYLPTRVETTRRNVPVGESLVRTFVDEVLCTWSIADGRVVKAVFDVVTADEESGDELAIYKHEIAYDYETLLESDFTLSAYGIDEPAQPGGNRLRVWLACLVFGVLSLLLVILRAGKAVETSG